VQCNAVMRCHFLEGFTQLLDAYNADFRNIKSSENMKTLEYRLITMIKSSVESSDDIDIGHGVKTLRTQDISAPSDWCQSARTIRHQCRNLSPTLQHWSRTVSTSSKHFCYNSHTGEKFTIIPVLLVIIKECRTTTQVHEKGENSNPASPKTPEQTVVKICVNDYVAEHYPGSSPFSHLSHPTKG